jgi:hypothetical protein
VCDGVPRLVGGQKALARLGGITAVPFTIRVVGVVDRVAPPTTESLRALKRRLSDVIYQALLADA